MKTLDRETRLKRFFEKIVDHSDKNKCWFWKGAKSQYKKISYGTFWDGKKHMMAHRFSYQSFVGKLINGLTIDHQCNNGLCVNPKHLKQMTLRENILRSVNCPAAINARKTHCKNGHKFSRVNKFNQRSCRRCRRGFEANRRLKLGMAVRGKNKKTKIEDEICDLHTKN